MEQVRFGIVGTGGMGTGHAQALGTMEEGILTAVCDIDRDVCANASETYHVPGFATHEELIDSGLVDAVIIATPHYFHPPIAIYAMGRGKHVLSEKPVAVTVSAADEMNRAAAASGVKFAVMYQNRSVPVYQAARRLVEQGRLGQIYRTCLIEPNYRSQAYYDSAGWRATWSGEGGGVLINQAPHGIDLFTWIGGLPSRVTAKTVTRRHNIEVEDEGSALLEYENGAVGFYHTSVNEFPLQGSVMEFCGELGKISISDGKLRFWSLDSSVQSYTTDSQEMWGKPVATEEDVPLEERATGHIEIIRNLANSILHGEALLSPGVEGIRTVEFLNAIILSGKKRKPVEVPVDRAEYDDFIERMRRKSRAKKLSGPAKRITDPQFARA